MTKQEYRNLKIGDLLQYSYAAELIGVVTKFGRNRFQDVVYFKYVHSPDCIRETFITESGAHSWHLRTKV